jgi:hypothetical protein
MARPTEVALVASGDLRETANRICWPAQEALERNVEAAFARHGVRVRRAHPIDASRGHGFISSQRMGMDVFGGIERDVLGQGPDRPVRRCGDRRLGGDRVR